LSALLIVLKIVSRFSPSVWNAMMHASAISAAGVGLFLQKRINMLIS